MALRRILKRKGCAYCGVELKHGTQQARRRFCSDAHKQKAARRRALGLPENLVIAGKRYDLIHAAR